MAQIEWFPKINDTSLKYIFPPYSVPVFEEEVLMKKVNTFKIWRNHCEKYKNLYVQILKSEYIYSIVPDLDNKVNGIWSIGENVGFTVENLKFRGLLNINDVYKIIPRNQMTLSNKDIFNIEISERLVSIKEYAKELYTKFLLSSEYKNVSRDVLAVKAINASNTFHESIEGYTKVYFSAKEIKL